MKGIMCRILLKKKIHKYIQKRVSIISTYNLYNYVIIPIILQKCYYNSIVLIRFNYSDDIHFGWYMCLNLVPAFKQMSIASQLLKKCFN